MTELQRLQDRVYQLEELLGLKLKAPTSLGLTATQEKMVGMLVKREIVSRGMFMDAIYQLDCDQRGEKVIEVHLVHLRRKLAVHDIQIKNHYNVGWYLEPAQRAKLKELMSGMRVPELTGTAGG